MWKLLVGLVFAGGVVLVLAGLRSTTDRVQLLRRAGVVLMAAFAILGAAWITAEAFEEPGGWRAVGVVGLWLVPLTLLLAISWYRVTWATMLLSALVAVVVGLSIWFAVDSASWRAFEDNNGPVRAVSSFVLAAPLALIGWRRPLPAGVLLVVLGAVPFALSAVGGFGGVGSITAVSLPPAMTGTLYVVAEAMQRRASPKPVVPTPASNRRAAGTNHGSRMAGL